jgi:hypothetical protein
MIGNALTAERPELWSQALALASATTGMAYLPKLPLADGTIWACGGGGGESSEETLKRERRQRRERPAIHIFPEEQDELGEEPAIPAKKTLSVSVPEGAMEWLLHEVGHFVAATPKERALRNYGLSESEIGHDGEREWQAWGFEEVILAPWGPARGFAPPSQRDGAAFNRAGPMPMFATDHAMRRLRELGIDIEAWRLIWGEWARWHGKPDMSMVDRIEARP